MLPSIPKHKMELIEDNSSDEEDYSMNGETNNKRAIQVAFNSSPTPIQSHQIASANG